RVVENLHSADERVDSPMRHSGKVPVRQFPLGTPDNKGGQVRCCWEPPPYGPQAAVLVRDCLEALGGSAATDAVYPGLMPRRHLLRNGHLQRLADAVKAVRHSSRDAALGADVGIQEPPC